MEKLCTIKEKNSKNHQNKCVLFYFLFTCFLIVTITSCSYNSSKVLTEYSVSSLGDTVSKMETFPEKGIKEVTYYEDINNTSYVSKVIQYKDDYKHGDSKTFHSNGKLKSIVVFKNDKIWEVKTYLDSSGTSIDYGEIHEGNGRLKRYYTDISVLKEEGNVVDGMKEGYWIEYCGNGIEVCDSVLFRNGRDEFMDEWEDMGYSFYQEYD